MRNNNRGSALLTVLIATMLLIIVISVLLFIAARTYKSREIDYQSKQNFYKAEEILDELKAILVTDCSDCCAYAYEETMNDFLNLSVSERKTAYINAFLTMEKRIWERNRIGSGGQLLDGVKALFNEEKAKCIESVGGLVYNQTKGYFEIKDIVVSETTIDGYYSRIKTSIQVMVPEVEWSKEAALKQDVISMEENVVYVNWERD